MNVEKKKTIILTILMNNEAQNFFDAKRKQYFPAFANFTTAHLTLFHCLPNKDFVFEKLYSIAAKINTFEMQISGLVHNKNFNCYQINSEILLELHKSLQLDFEQVLSQKDLKPIKPHITIQNKTTAYKAQKTYEILLADFETFTAKALGISCWYFTKNKWEKHKDYLFTQKNISS